MISKISNKKTYSSKFITSITDKKLREKLIREKTLNLKTTIELITQDSYDRRHKQSTIPPALAKDKEIKQEPIQKSKQNNTENNQNKRKTTADSADNKIGHPNITARRNWYNATTARERDTSPGYAARNQTKQKEPTIWKI